MQIGYGKVNLLALLKFDCRTVEQINTVHFKIKMYGLHENKEYLTYENYADEYIH